MTEAIATVAQAKTAKAGASMNATLNYAIVAVVLLGAIATMLAMSVW